MTVNVRDVAENDFFAWLPVFDAACRSRGARLDDTKALVVWSWIQDDRNALRASVAVDEAGELVGLVHYHQEPRTLDASTGFVIDDLFVAEAQPRAEVAGLLLARVRAAAAEVRATRIRWTTDADDATGLGVSDQVARRSPAVVFEMDV